MPDPNELLLLSIEAVPADYELGGIVVVSHVRAVNILRDFREMLTNVTGGHMKRYEALLKEALDEVESRFRSELIIRGYDGAVGVRIAHPQVVGGGAELIMYGTGIKLRL
ncbi:MAG: heavy metal-binding domain-containing protein [Paracoccaceae bacterium]|nr:heavy metal-binding domain-containing protein [Paracoccaceae bacterium]